MYLDHLFTLSYDMKSLASFLRYVQLIEYVLRTFLSGSNFEYLVIKLSVLIVSVRHNTAECCHKARVGCWFSQRMLLL